MSSVNRVTLIGNLGAEPELKYLPSGQAVCEMRIATNEKWKDKDGQDQERVEWHRLVIWGKTGEACAKYLKKGRSVYVEGRIQTRSWEDKESGEKKYMTEIVANNVQFLGDGKGRDSDERSSDDVSDPRDEPQKGRKTGKTNNGSAPAGGVGGGE